MKAAIASFFIVISAACIVVGTIAVVQEQWAEASTFYVLALLNRPTFHI